MTAREWLELAAGTVAYVLGLFGGFLAGFAPPLHPLEADGGFALGFGSILMMCVFLLIAGGVRVLGRRVRPRVWLIVSGTLLLGFVATGFAYHDYRDDYSFSWDGPEGVEVFIAGDSLTRGAAAYADTLRAQGSAPTNEALVRDYGGPASAADVWPEGSIDRVERRMEVGYLAALLAVSSCLFFLVEGLLPYATRQLGPVKRGPPTRRP